ncbi:MAG TPA: DsbA family protein [Gemmatimonadaceae bacterium]|nr:DsbA family protein [Gemmatimonadaceae bacterium]
MKKGEAKGGAKGAGGRPSAVRRTRQSQTGKLVGVLVAIAVIGVAALGYAYTTGKNKVRTVDPNAKPLVAEGHVMGNPAAPLQVLEFGDFECPQCGNFSVVSEPDVRKRLIEPGTISLRYFDFPLPMHRNTWPASNAAACAEEQGKFWQMHDQLYANQSEWNGEATGRPKSMFLNYAKAIGLDGDKFEQCFDAEKYRPKIEANAQEAERRGINSTPTFVIGKRVVPGNIGYDAFKKYVDSALVEAKAAGTTATSSPAATPATTTAPAAAATKPR